MISRSCCSWTRQGRLRDLKPEWDGAVAGRGARAGRGHPPRRGTGSRARSRCATPSASTSAPGARVEPLVSLQWFCQMDELAATALDAVRSGRIRFHPKRLEKVFFDWMESIRPWCISRQLWWGHRLPVWFAPDGSYVVQPDRPDGDGWKQSTDVLDTWFSSALWPYRDAGLARGHAVAAPLVPGQRAVDGAGHHQPLGGADDLHRHRVRRRHPIHRRVHPLDDPGRRRTPHVEVARHRRRPARPDRPLRRRRHPLRPPEDVLDPGRAVRRGHDRGGPRVHATSCGTRRGWCCSAPTRTRCRGADAAPSRSTAGS